MNGTTERTGRVPIVVPALGKEKAGYSDVVDGYEFVVSTDPDYLNSVLAKSISHDLVLHHTYFSFSISTLPRMKDLITLSAIQKVNWLMRNREKSRPG